MKLVLSLILLGFAVVGATPGMAEEKEKKRGFDPKTLLVTLVLKADKDGDGALSTEEFRKVPVLKEVKTDRVDAAFATIDTDADGSLTADEIGKGFRQISDLLKKEKSQGSASDAVRDAKKDKRQAKS